MQIHTNIKVILSSLHSTLLFFLIFHLKTSVPVILLNEVEKELFQCFSDAHGNMSRIATADGFVDGFCLGMRIAIEVMQKRY